MRTKLGWLFMAAALPLLGAAFWVGTSSSEVPVQFAAMGLVLTAAAVFGVGSRLLRVGMFRPVR